MIETARLRLRPWREADKPVFHDIINTPAMMLHFGGPRPRDQIDALIDAQMAKQAADGHCMWAVETLADGALAGVCGLRIGGHPGTPVDRMYELGWRIAEKHWGQGIAREAAEASRDWGWANTPAQTIAAWTNPQNARSWGLMIRIGMERRTMLDFRHPSALESDDPIGDMRGGSGNLNSGDKWIADLTAAMLAASRRQDEQATPPEPQSGFQGEGGVGCREGGEDAGRAGAAV